MEGRVLVIGGEVVLTRCLSGKLDEEVLFCSMAGMIVMCIKIFNELPAGGGGR